MSATIVKFSLEEERRRKMNRAKQSFDEECNINNIMARYEETGVLGNPLFMNKRQPFYGDFSTFPDLAKQLDMVDEAVEAWERLPAKVRQRFNGDPRELIEFVKDEKNRPEAITLGLLPAPKPEPKPVRVEVVSQTPPADPEGGKK